VPRLTPGAPLAPADRLFEPVPMGKPLGRVLGQLVWMFTIGGEGGLFVMIGRRAATKSIADRYLDPTRSLEAGRP